MADDSEDAQSGERDLGAHVRLNVSGVEEYVPAPANADPAAWDDARWYVEEAALLVTTVKWAFLGVAAGLCVGLGTRAFLWALAAGTNIAGRLDVGWFHHTYLLPLALPACVWLIRSFAPTAKGHGTEAVIRAVHEQSGRVEWPVAPVKLLATVITLGFGGSAGKEGPCAQIGAALASAFADVLRLDDADRRRLVICGIGAGFAAVFGTPISGAIFGIEVLYLGRIEYPVLFPCMVAGIVAHLTCGVVPPSAGLTVGLGAMSQSEALCWALLSGIFFGIVAIALIESMRWLESRLTRFRSHPYWVAFVGGVLLAGMYAVAGRQYSGLGLPTIQAALAGAGAIFVGAFAVKIVATSVTLGTGGSGGIITPLFFIGSTAGAAFAHALHLPAGAFAAFGFVALVAAGANTPIAAAIMSMEMLPAPVGVFAAVSASAAFLIVGHRSVYSSQRLGMVKSAALQTALGGPVGSAHGGVHVRPGSRFADVMRAFARFRRHG